MKWTFLNKIYSGYLLLASLISNALLVKIVKTDNFSMLLDNNRSMKLLIFAILLYLIGYKIHFVSCPEKLRKITNFEEFLSKHKTSVKTGFMKDKIIDAYNLSEKKYTKNSHKIDILYAVFTHDNNDKKFFQVSIYLLIFTAFCIYTIIDLHSVYVLIKNLTQ